MPQISSPWSPPPQDSKVRTQPRTPSEPVWGEKSQGTFQPRAEDKDFNTSQLLHSHKIFFNIRNILGNIFKSICHYL